MPKIIVPLGPEAGRELPIDEALRGLAIEILAHRSDLQEQARRLALRAGREAESQALAQRAADLERYATALYAIAAQLDPERYRPDAHAGLVELAAVHGIVLPDWMKGKPHDASTPAQDPE